MSETTGQKTRRKFKQALNMYLPQYLTSIQFTDEATPTEVTEFFKILRKSLRYHHDGVLVFWLRTNRTKYKVTYPMICIFTQTCLDTSVIQTESIDSIVYKILQKEWTSLLSDKWLNNKEMFDNELFRDFYNLNEGGKRNPSRLAIANKDKVIEHENILSNDEWGELPF